MITSFVVKEGSHISVYAGDVHKQYEVGSITTVGTKKKARFSPYDGCEFSSEGLKQIVCVMERYEGTDI